MSNPSSQDQKDQKGPKRPWEQRLHDAGSRVEEDLRNIITYINDEVVPDVRRNGSEALRAAAAELHRLAQKMDDRAGRTPPPPPPPEGTSKP
ncbi:MAG: hypothetical protein JWQ42_93 [Edaphobacter sp.]|jgi:hypothetical protein|nr:hypothetical protein [Edaphobacter sp.]MCU1319576.1 hypothetical protein [Edaphobacter sp.]